MTLLAALVLDEGSDVPYAHLERQRDEADQMDLGFLPIVRRLLEATPARRPAAAVLGHPRRRGERPRAAFPGSPGS